MKKHIFFESGAFLLIGLVFLFFVGGCSHTQAAKPGTPQESTSSALEGKKICIDPGHGGASSGAVGHEGLKESDINLKEALMLKEMLEDAGATVVMTRSDDSDIGITDRWKFNRAENAELFVSMHHNANAQGDDSMNRTEVFYHWNDRGGPSEDAARILYEELQALLLLHDGVVGLSLVDRADAGDA